MKHLVIILILFFGVGTISHSQESLSKEFHKNRREEFRKLMPDNSVAFIFSYPERNYSNDVYYNFHQNPDLYYLSGFTDPMAVLVIFKEMQTLDGSITNEMMFVKVLSKNSEIWGGKKLGINGTKQLGFSHVHDIKNYKNFSLYFKKFDKVIYKNFIIDENNSISDQYLLKTFLNMNIIEEGNIVIHTEKRIIARDLTLQSLSGFENFYKEKIPTNEAFEHEPLITEILNKPDSIALDSIVARAKKEPSWGVDIYENIMIALRQIKTHEELELIRKAIKITCDGHIEVMKSINPEMSENEVEGIHIYVHKKNGALSEGFPPMVGSGENGCILHYTQNNKEKIGNNLVVMDIGAEYMGYCADVTRTIPANGKFSTEQKELYELVYKTNNEILKLCKVGTPFQDLNKKANETIGKGLLELGIIKDLQELNIYYPHSCSHYLGLDAHDLGDYHLLKENMVITVEPGIYIPENSNCDKKWWNIGILIEDDVLIKKDGYELLSSSVPKKWEEIEKTQKNKKKF